jgi:RHS repeat-associated protein
VNSSGQVKDHLDYDGFGNVTEVNAAYGDRIKYTARWYDPDTGLQYNRARWYQPSTGDWISEDPSGFGAGDPNLDRYVGNNPTNAVDPMGLAPLFAAPTLTQVTVADFVKNTVTYSGGGNLAVATQKWNDDPKHTFKIAGLGAFTLTFGALADATGKQYTQGIGMSDSSAKGYFFAWLFANSIAIPGYSGTVVQTVSTSLVIKNAAGKITQEGDNFFVEGFGLDKGTIPGLDIHALVHGYTATDGSFSFKYTANLEIGAGYYVPGPGRKQTCPAGKHTYFVKPNSGGTKADFNNVKWTGKTKPWSYTVTGDFKDMKPKLTITGLS